MIGKLRKCNGKFCFDCYDSDTFAELLMNPDVSHVGGPTFEVIPGQVAAAYAELVARYGAVAS